MADETGIGTILDTLTKGGAVGVMAVGLWAFLTGRIVSEKSHDEAVKNQKEIAELTAKALGETICKDIKNGVAEGMKQGIAEGYLEINNKGDA